MSTLTPNYGLHIPEDTDSMDDFFENYSEDLQTIDENMGGGGGGSANIRELTQAEYDALPDTKYSDNVEYLIKDRISPSEAYSYMFTVINGAINVIYDDGT